ncbi:hypothetical protein ACFL42_04875, partial [Candidatus Omnitrophota bacterium]
CSVRDVGMVDGKMYVLDPGAIKQMPAGLERIEAIAEGMHDDITTAARITSNESATKCPIASLESAEKLKNMFPEMKVKIYGGAVKGSKNALHLWVEATDEAGNTFYISHTDAQFKQFAANNPEAWKSVRVVDITKEGARAEALANVVDEASIELVSKDMVRNILGREPAATPVPMRGGGPVADYEPTQLELIITEAESAAPAAKPVVTEELAPVKQVPIVTPGLQLSKAETIKKGMDTLVDASTTSGGAMSGEVYAVTKSIGNVELNPEAFLTCSNCASVLVDKLMDLGHGELAGKFIELSLAKINAMDGTDPKVADKKAKLLEIFQEAKRIFGIKNGSDRKKEIGKEDHCALPLGALVGSELLDVVNLMVASEVLKGEENAVIKVVIMKEITDQMAKFSHRPSAGDMDTLNKLDSAADYSGIEVFAKQTIESANSAGFDMIEDIYGTLDSLGGKVEGSALFAKVEAAFEAIASDIVWAEGEKPAFEPRAPGKERLSVRSLAKRELTHTTFFNAGNGGKEALQTIVAHLVTPSTRENALMMLTWLLGGDTDMAKGAALALERGIERSLKKGYRSIARTSVNALIAAGSPEAIGTLAGLLKGDTLSAPDKKEISSIVIAGFESGDARTSLSCARVLAAFGSEGSVAVLTKTLKGDDLTKARTAALALFENPDAISKNDISVETVKSCAYRLLNKPTLDSIIALNKALTTLTGDYRKTIASVILERPESLSKALASDIGLRPTHDQIEAAAALREGASELLANALVTPLKLEMPLEISKESRAFIMAFARTAVMSVLLDNTGAITSGQKTEIFNAMVKPALEGDPKQISDGLRVALACLRVESDDNTSTAIAMSYDLFVDAFKSDKADVAGNAIAGFLTENMDSIIGIPKEGDGKTRENLIYAALESAGKIMQSDDKKMRTDIATVANTFLSKEKDNSQDLLSMNTEIRLGMCADEVNTARAPPLSDGTLNNLLAAIDSDRKGTPAPEMLAS